MMMNGTAMLLCFLLVAVLLVVPFWRLVPHSGISTWFAVLAVIPVGAVILLWPVAFRDQLADRNKV